MGFINEMVLLRGKNFFINDKLSIKHPTLNEIVDLDKILNKNNLPESMRDEFGEDLYYYILSLFCSTPYDYMVELKDAGINWEERNNYDIFLDLYNFETYSELINWLFGGTFFFEHRVNSENNELLLYDPINDIIIDRLIFEQISYFLRRINFQNEKSEFAPANEAARELVLEQKRKEAKKRQRRTQIKDSQLSTLISFLTWNNTSGMKSDDIFKLHIYGFHDGVRRLVKTSEYRNIMLGYYTGNISHKEIDFNKIDYTGKTTVDN